MQFKDLRISSSFHPEVPLDADDLSENYDEDPFYVDFDDSARHVAIIPDKELNDEEGKEEVATNNEAGMAAEEEQNFFGLDHLRQSNGEQTAAVPAIQ